MRYLVIYRPEAGEEGGAPDPAHMAAMGKLVDEMTTIGSLISTEPLRPRANGARIRHSSSGAFEVTDETQRAAGFAFLRAGSRAEAIELCKQFLAVAGDGETELREIMEFAPPS